MTSVDSATTCPRPDPGRRSFLGLSTAAMGVLGGGAFTWTLIDSMNPAADLPQDLWIELSRIPLGGRAWFDHNRTRQLIYLVHRRPEEVAALREEPWQALIDPEPDRARVQRPEWLVVRGDCSFDRWPLYGQGFWRDWTRWHNLAEWAGSWDGWHCQFCGSQYDLSGRVRARTGGEEPRRARLSLRAS